MPEPEAAETSRHPPIAPQESMPPQRIPRGIEPRLPAFPSADRRRVVQQPVLLRNLARMPVQLDQVGPVDLAQV